MLRCPSSRINLSPNDITAFEQRFAARQIGRRTTTANINVRLSPGPARSTSLSLVPADQNIGRKRAASSSSEATIHDGDAPLSNEAQQSIYDASPVTLETFNSNLHVTTTAAYPRPTPRRQVDSYYETPSENSDQNLSPPEPLSSRGLDDFIPTKVTAVQDMYSFHLHQAAPSAAMATPPESSTKTPRPDPPRQLLSSARARRRYGQRREELPDDITSGKNLTTVSVASSPIVMPVPDLVVPSESDETFLNLALDPGAPVFVPRIRFGTAAGSSIEAGSNNDSAPRWSSVDSTHSAVDLRIRSSNNNTYRRPIRDTSGNPYSRNQIILQTENGLHRQRRRSRTTEQSSSIFRLTANIDRYPQFRPASLVTGRRYSTRLSPNFGTHHVRQMSPSLSHLHQPTGLRLGTDATRHPAGHGFTYDRSSHGRPISSALPGDSRSTPNLMCHSISLGRVYSRGSSLSWDRSRYRMMDSYPDIVDASICDSSNGDRSRQHSSTDNGLDATAEFFRMRNSPLDDLTERFSRLSTRRTSSAERARRRAASCERPFSLLAGDPFQAAESRSVLQAMGKRSHGSSVTLPLDIELEAQTVVDATLFEPNTTTDAAEIKASPNRATKITATPSSFSKRKPVPSSCKTPKVPIYDDSKPPNTQPQTSADLDKSTRRGKARSDGTTAVSPLQARGRSMASPPSPPPPPPSIPERRPHRHTYPSGSSDHQAVNNATVSAVRPSAVASPSATEITRHVRRRPVRQSNVQLENDLDGHLAELEGDRQTWMSRREAGPMDVTPPKEGRYERYLS